MSIDPGMRRARRLVALVIFTVAVPSMLLTGLAAVAVDSEEAAARQRFETTYRSVMYAMARRFNQRMRALTDASPDPLANLAEWVKDPDADSAEIESFWKATEPAINYFVFGPDDRRLWPVSDGPALSPRMVKALKAERRRDGEGGACDDYQDLFSEDSLDEDARCLAKYAFALCRTGSGSKAAKKARHAFSSHCARSADSTVVKHGFQFASAWSKRRTHPELSAKAAETLVRSLSRPTVATPLAWRVVTAQWSHDRLWCGATQEGESWQLAFRSIATQGELYASLQKEGRRKDDRVMIESRVVNQWRRVTITRNVGGYRVGAELEPMLFTRFFQKLAQEKEIDALVHVFLFGIDAPWMDYARGREEELWSARHKVEVMLKQSDLAWMMVLMAKEPDTGLSLSGSRSSLYFWALILLVIALVGGIVLTMTTVMKEARMSRLKTDFVSSVSHDLRTPLTSIRMFTETLLLGRVNNDKEQHEFLEIIALETERLTRLTERILDFSRMEAGRKTYEFTTEPVSGLVEHAVSACRPILGEAGFDTQTEVASQLSPVRVDRDAIIEVLINLVTNAVKYSPNDRNIRIEAYQEDGWVAIHVKDRGIGIPRSEQRRIFDKFYRVDCRRASEVGGCGIGLSLVQHIIDAHGGEVSVVSTEGEGSAFTIRLPVPGELPSRVARDAEFEGQKPWRASSS